MANNDFEHNPEKSGSHDMPSPRQNGNDMTPDQRQHRDEHSLPGTNQAGKSEQRTIPEQAPQNQRQGQSQSQGGQRQDSDNRKGHPAEEGSRKREDFDRQSGIREGEPNPQSNSGPEGDYGRPT
jgi:hypothetical protein